MSFKINLIRRYLLAVPLHLTNRTSRISHRMNDLVSQRESRRTLALPLLSALRSLLSYLCDPNAPKMGTQVAKPPVPSAYSPSASPPQSAQSPFSAHPVIYILVPSWLQYLWLSPIRHSKRASTVSRTPSKCILGAGNK